MQFPKIHNGPMVTYMSLRDIHITETVIFKVFPHGAFFFSMMRMVILLPTSTCIKNNFGLKRDQYW